MLCSNRNEQLFTWNSLCSLSLCRSHVKEEIVLQTDFSSNKAMRYINWYSLMAAGHKRQSLAVAYMLWVPTFFLIVAYFIRG